MDPGNENDPMEVMRTILETEGHDLDKLWMDHRAHMVTYDYAMGDRYRSYVEYYEDFYSESSNQIAAEVPSEGTALSLQKEPRQQFGSRILNRNPRSILHMSDSGLPWHSHR